MVGWMWRGPQGWSIKRVEEGEARRYLPVLLRSGLSRLAEPSSRRSPPADALPAPEGGAAHPEGRGGGGGGSAAAVGKGG